jgi:hypothetical protein
MNRCCVASVVDEKTRRVALLTVRRLISFTIALETALYSILTGVAAMRRPISCGVDKAAAFYLSSAS